MATRPWRFWRGCGTKRENRSGRQGALHGFRPTMKSPSAGLFESLQSQGMQLNQQVDFLSDGGEDVRNLQLYLNPQAEHLLDWFHLTMRLTVLNQIAKGLPERVGEGEVQYELRPGLLKDLGRIKWYLWHGNVFQALNELQSLEVDLDAAAFESETTDGMEPAWSTSPPADTYPVLDEEWENTFRRWYPDFRPQRRAKKAA